jgi:hypothetical protein
VLLVGWSLVAICAGLGMAGAGFAFVVSLGRRRWPRVVVAWGLLHE